MTAASTTFEQGLTFQRTGNLNEAERIYRKILDQDPSHADAAGHLAVIFQARGRLDDAVNYYQQSLRFNPANPQVHNNLGIALVLLGKKEEGVRCFQEAIRVKVDYADAENNLGNVLAELGETDEAIFHYRQALRINPQSSDARNNLANTLVNQGKLEEAVASYRQSLQFKPDSPLTHNNLGNALAALGRLEEAELSFRQAVRYQPGHPDALNSLGNILASQGKQQEALAFYEQVLLVKPDHAEATNNLGNALGVLNRHGEAIEKFKHALKIKPRYGAAYNNMGNSYMELGNRDEAVRCYEEALKIDPKSPEANNNFGNLLRDLGRFEEARQRYDEALRLRPRYADAWSNLGNALVALNLMEEGVEAYRRALQIKPDFAHAHWNLSLAWLLLGKFEEGWKEYEWRWKCKGFARRNLVQPLWDGSPLEGQTILLYTEQGLGDTLQFIRYGEKLKEFGATVLLECAPSFVPLLSTYKGVDAVIPQGSALPYFNVQSPLLSLPGLLGTRLDTVPARVPYLSAREDLVKTWRQQLAGLKGYKIGIAWQGNPKFGMDRHRSIPLMNFHPLAALDEVHLISLQKGFGSEQILQVAGRFPVIDLGSRLDSESGAFMDTAAVMKNMDLVITSDTATAHLAGALGVPVWMAISRAGDWRWMLQSVISPWYPSMRIFRQEKLGDWLGVFNNMAGELRKTCAISSTPGAIRVEVSPGELIDKITILEIKNEQIEDEKKLVNVRHELRILQAAQENSVPFSKKLESLKATLRSVNEELWHIEDDIRTCERDQNFGPEFIEFARAICRENERRAMVKREINELLGSRIVEEKSYRPFKTDR